MKAVLVALLALGACKSDGGMSHPDIDAPNVPKDTSTGGPDTPTADGWTPLISRSWTLSPGETNTYKCTRIMVTHDMWVAGFRAASPTGTHHSVLTISTNSTQTGDYDCSVGTLDNEMLYAAGVGTDDLLFPAGVAMHIPAGTYVNLNLHLFNATDDPLADTSGVLVKVMDQAAVQHEADMMFSGTFNLNGLAGIPNDGQPHTYSGGCTVPSGGWHVFTLWPHMHQIATHQKWSYKPTGGQAVTLIDDNFQFMEQKNYPIPDTVLAAGTQITTECTYVNTTGGPITWGDGSNKEMCFTGMYKYPAGGSLFQCATH